MFSTASLAETAALVGDPARAAMLMALMDGRALTASELARAAGVTPQTASGHLARLTAAGLLGLHCQGRHHYHRLASPAVARMLESIIEVTAASEADRPRKAVVTGPRDKAMRAARTCYDHLAGQLGVRLADALGERGYVELSDEGGAVTEPGMDFFRSFGLDLGPAPALGRDRARRSGRIPCRFRLPHRPRPTARHSRARRAHRRAAPRAGRPDGRSRSAPPASPCRGAR